MRLRQVALVCRDLDKVVHDFEQVLGLKVAYVDPNVAKYGLRNAVLPCGTAFLEVVEPTSDAASASRFLAKRGSDAGYMVILQVEDAMAERDRVAGLGVRVVEIIDRPNYFCAHFHPADFGGILASLDQQRGIDDHLAPDGDWMPAGPDWRRARTDEVVEMLAVTISTPEPDRLATAWSRLLARPLDRANLRRVPLEHGAVTFETPAPSSMMATSASAKPLSTVVSAVTLQVVDVAAIEARARAAGALDHNGRVVIGGLGIRLTS